jgi:thiosulfate/3-mercaptopyruvate sulfurtransferase
MIPSPTALPRRRVLEFTRPEVPAVVNHLMAAVVTIVTLHYGETRAAAAPTNPRDELLVSTEWLANHLADPNLVLLHVGEPDEYRAEHIAGARLITLRDISTSRAPGALSLEMLEPDELRRRLEKLGISDDSQIVVYYGQDWVSPATRVVLTLDWIRLGDRTSLLDGGMPRWKREGRAVTGVVPVAAKPGRLSARRATRGDLIVDHLFVQRSIKAPGVTIVDARAATFYDGPSHGEHRAGHIPSAVNLPFNSVFGDDLRLLSADSLATLFRRAGVRRGDALVVYCHIGQQATAVIFAARSLGYTARLYDGSFDDWSARKELPVEGGRAGAHR